MNVHQKPRAGILLEVDLSVRPESYYYYYYYYYYYTATNHSQVFIGCDWLLHRFIEVNFSKLMDSKPNFQE